MAHELRTPLTGLHAAAELLPTELVRDRVAAPRTLTEDLLEISRLDTGRERLEAGTEQLAPSPNGSYAPREPPEPTRPYSRDTGRRGPVVTLRDHGDGYPEYLVEHGPRRFRTEGGATGLGLGLGLGLTIALGQAEVLGARLDFANVPQSEGGDALETLTPAESRGPATNGAV